MKMPNVNDAGSEVAKIGVTQPHYGKDTLVGYTGIMETF
jgi:hypothetical protein